MKSRSKAVFRTCLVLLWMAFIYRMSAFSADESELQSGFLVHLIELLCAPFLKNTDAAGYGLFLGTASFCVRKAAHMTEYAVLAVLTRNALSAWGMKEKFFLPASFTAAALYAATDEFHQLFVSGRAGQLRDVLIDCTGALIGLTAAIRLPRIFPRRQGNAGPRN